MNKYKVTITETLQKEIEVEASSKEEAIYQIKQQYKNEKIVLTADDYVYTDFNVIFQDKHKDFRER